MFKFLLPLTTLSILTVVLGFSGNKELTEENSTTFPVSLIQDNKCPIWFYYNDTTEQCECYGNPFVVKEAVRCGESRALLGYSFCMTFEKETNTVSVGHCSYFELRGHNISEPGFIDLPDNILELNDYMCGPMNRRGIVCSECVDGFGPSVTSPRFRCSNCTNASYAVPVYLLLELLPVTVFYLIVLVFQLNLTSAPMVSFIFYSNIAIVAFNSTPMSDDQSQTFQTIFATIYGIWTLDFFRYAVPPFCISPNLKIIHIYYLQSVSAIFPFVLITFTWICIKLHSRNYRLVVWLWKLLNNVIFKHINVKCNSNRTVIDVFATFFLLSFSKVTFVLLLPLASLKIHNFNTVNISSYDPFHSYTYPSVNFASKEHLPYLVVSTFVFLFAILPPVVFLAFYPVKKFRGLFFKCLPKSLRCSINIFLEKFYSCYRDGLDGGKDMRSFACLYFFIVLLTYSLLPVVGSHLYIAVLFGGCSLVIANVQPYKKKYMSVVDSLIFANMALVTSFFDRSIYAFPFFRIITGISILTPTLVLIIFVLCRLLKKPVWRLVRTHLEFRLPCCKDDQIRVEPENAGNNHEIEFPDRIIHPEFYVQVEDNSTY